MRDSPRRPRVAPLASGTLGSAGPNVTANFPNRPIGNTWYPFALADALAGQTRKPPTTDAQLGQLLLGKGEAGFDVMLKQWDAKGKGEFSKAQMRLNLRQAGFQVSSAACDALFDAWDEDGGGSLDFEDFLGQVKMMNRAGNVGSMAASAGVNLGGGVDAAKIKEATEKMKRYEKYVDAMSAEERKAPDLFLKQGKRPEEAAEVDERIERVAKDSGASVEDINAFIKEFYLMKIAAQKFASGMSEEELKREMAVEQQKMGDPMSRAARRKLDQMADSGTGSKKKKAKSKKSKLSELRGFS